ncbi:AI-2E family transporter [Aphanothece sacrum]|uniref:Membrane protein n=1 Tax=Aphanothece sacrum FPU1 TaxID=1920663 RepID=A0A401IFI4_APHSA|nr:AI-2E family transporter [Aphanothece sacrum]GBF80052.1 membrane protein [Aphanothece sacrum FPU1]GBF84595.1 membrane protein [Aphanothece sacrum FPU3]
MTEKKQLSSILPLLIGVACVVIIVAGMRAASSILNSFFLGLMIAIGIAPLLRWLNSKRIPQGLALVLVILGVLVAGLIFITFLGVSLSQLSETLPSYELKLTEFKDHIEVILRESGLNAQQLIPLSQLSIINYQLSINNKMSFTIKINPSLTLKFS